MIDDDDGGHGVRTMRTPRWPEPDAHGQAALLLAESILHLLMEAGILTSEQAVDAVRTAAAVKVEAAEQSDESETQMRRSLGLLNRIEISIAGFGQEQHEGRDTEDA